MGDKILTPEQVLRIRARGCPDDSDPGPSCADLCDSHETLRAERDEANEAADIEGHNAERLTEERDRCRDVLRRVLAAQGWPAFNLQPAMTIAEMLDGDLAALRVEAEREVG